MMLFRLYAVSLAVLLPLLATAEDLAPRRFPFPIPGRTEQAGWETTLTVDAEDDEDETLTPPALLNPPIRQTAAQDEGYVAKMYPVAPPQPIKSEVPATLIPRYRAAQRLAPKNTANNKLPTTQPPQENAPGVVQVPSVPVLPAPDAAPLRAVKNSLTLVAAAELPTPPLSTPPLSAPPSPASTLLAPPAPKETTPIPPVAESPYTVNNVSDETAAASIECSTAKLGGYKTQGAFFFDGWFSGGILHNPDLPTRGDNTPLLYNDRNGEAVLNQFYLSFGRSVNQKQSGFDIGGRIDLLYGTDYFYTSSLGLETRQTEYIFGEPVLDPLEAVLHWNSNKGSRRLGTAALYGLSMPQVYAEVHFPWRQGITLRAGHFYSGMSKESAMSVQNFFYSHSYSFMYANPTTLTGATAAIQLNSQTSAVFGITNGWNTVDRQTLNTAQPKPGASYLMGFEWRSTRALQRKQGDSSLSFYLHTGEESFRDGDPRTSYALTYNKQLSRRWSYSLEHTLGYEKNGALLNSWTQQRGKARWASIAQYLQWTMNERLSFAARLEWFCDEGQSRIQKSPVIDPGFRELTGEDYYALTLGANWQPVHYIVIRPEVRYDWSNIRINGQRGVYSGGTKSDMLSFAIDGTIRF